MEEECKDSKNHDFLYPPLPLMSNGELEEDKELISLVGRRWKYRGEGGANLVKI